MQIINLKRRALRCPEEAAFTEVVGRMKEIKELSARVRCLCWGETARIMDLPVPAVDRSVSGAWEKLQGCAGVSPFFQSLLELLGAHVHEAPRQFRCIVFVETRAAARMMTQMLKFVAGSERTFAWISPVCLLGHCKNDSESMTMAQQNGILCDFKDGKTNVMVATSVAEEGIDIPCCNLVVRMEPAQTVIQFVQARGRARYKTSHYVILCCDAFGETGVVEQLVERESAMQRYLDTLEVSFAADNCWMTCSNKEREPLLALDPRSHDSEHLFLGTQQIVLGELEVDIDELVPTQATVKKTFGDRRCLLDTMVNLVRNPDDLRRLPLMRAASGMSCLLGRRSTWEDDRQVWFSADNRRCFVLKVAAPLIQLFRIRILQVNWTDEFDNKLAQCPQLDAWATDQPSIEAVRNEVIARILDETPPERPMKCARHVARDFEPDSDYVSMVNRHLQRTHRPHSGQMVARYKTLRATAPFQVEIQIDQQVWQGLPQSKIKLAKQSAAFEAWKSLEEMSVGSRYIVLTKKDSEGLLGWLLASIITDTVSMCNMLQYIIYWSI